MTDQTLVQVPIDQISIEEGHNPRTAFETQAIMELSASIAQRGLLEPITVRAENGGYVLVAGERRLRACQGGVLDVVPCIVQNGRSDDPAERLTDALVENLQREDISVADEVRAYGRLKEDHSWDAKTIALNVGLPQNRVTKRMQLLVLPVDSIDAAAALNEKARKALVLIARQAPDVAGEVAKWLDSQADEVKVDFGKAPVARLRSFLCTKDFPVLGQDGQYDAANFLVSEEAHDARTELASSGYGGVWVRVSKEALADADAISATVELADGKVILGWDACCQVASDYLVRALKERQEQRAEYDERNASHQDTGGPSSRVVVDESGAQVTDEDEKKKIRSDRHKAEVEERIDAQGFNDALGAALIGRLPKLELTAGLARLLSRLVLAKHGRDYVMRGFRYVHPNGKIEPEGRSKVVKYVESDDLKRLLDDWLAGARKTDEILARTFILLLAAEYADDRATARSNRGGERPERGGYGGPTDAPDVIPEELDKLLKKALPAKLYEQALDRSRALAQRNTFGGYAPGPDDDASDEDPGEGPFAEPDSDTPGADEDLDEAAAEVAETE